MFGSDISLFQALHRLAGHSQWLNWTIVFLGQYLPYVLVIAFLYFIFTAPQGRRLYIFSLATISVILSWGIFTQIIRFFLFEARPFVALSFTPLIYQPATEAAFPSGHMALLVPIGLALWQLSRKKGALFLGLTVVVGIARIVAGVHWPSDIIGGMIVGAVSFYLVKAFFREKSLLADASPKTSP
jgi:undecaprenyl-diphosphatase